MPARKKYETVGAVRPHEVRIVFGAPVLAPLAQYGLLPRIPCRLPGPVDAFRAGAIQLTAERRAELIRVNADVNRTIMPRRSSESVINKKWLIAPKVGDCNDYAVTKRHQLWRAAGRRARFCWRKSSFPQANIVSCWWGSRRARAISSRIIYSDHPPMDQAGYRWVRTQSPSNPMFWSTVREPEREIAAIRWQPNQGGTEGRISSEAVPTGDGR